MKRQTTSSSWFRKILLICYLSPAALCISNPASAQNPMYKLRSMYNSSIEYLPTTGAGGTNEYLLCGRIIQNTIYNSSTGTNMNNVYAGMPIPRIYLQTLDDSLGNTMIKTYCTVGEVNDWRNGRCPRLSTAFFATDARQTADGGYIVCGHVVRDNEFTDCDPVNTFNQPFLLKTDASGVPQWFKRYQINNVDYARFNSVIEDPSTGNFIVCGHTAAHDGLIVWTNSSGSLINSRRTQSYRIDSTAQTLISEYTKIASYVPASAPPGTQYYVLTGTVGGEWVITGVPNHGGGLLTVVDGNPPALPGAPTLYNNVQISEDNYSRFCHLFGVADSYAGDNVVLTGFSGGASCTQASGWSTCLIEINGLNNAISFSKDYAINFQNPSMTSRGMKVIHDPSSSGNIYVTGFENTNGMGANPYALYLETDNLGQTVTGGYVQHSTSNTFWGTSITYNTYGSFPVYAGDDNPNTDAFVVKNNTFSTGGGWSGCANQPGSYISYINVDIINNDNWEIPVAEIDDQVYDYDPSHTEAHACGNSSKPAPTSVGSKLNKGSVTVLPNPASDFIDINLPNSGTGLVTLYNIQGSKVATKSLVNGKTIRMSVSELPSGLYVVNVNTGKSVMVGRFFKQ